MIVVRMWYVNAAVFLGVSLLFIDFYDGVLGRCMIHFYHDEINVDIIFDISRIKLKYVDFIPEMSRLMSTCPLDHMERAGPYSDYYGAF